MRRFSGIKSGFIALSVCALGSVPGRADTVTLTEGTPAPSLSPVLNYDVNFDSIPTGTLITAGLYASAGIASITNNGLPLYTYPSTQSSPNYVGTGPSDGWAGDITIVFGAFQSVVGFGDAGPNTTTFDAYNSAGTEIFSDTFSSATNDYWVLTDTTGANISSIEVISSFIAIDDVQFDTLSPTTITPEPAYIVPLGTVLLGFVFARRRLTLKRR
jgi:hypothetical protein